MSISSQLSDTGIATYKVKPYNVGCDHYREDNEPEAQVFLRTLGVVGSADLELRHLNGG